MTQLTLKKEKVGKRESARETEIDAVVFIKNNLKEMGWDIRNPERHPNGQVYTQNQCLENEEIRKHLVKDRPEYIVKLSETQYWIIEAKRQRSQIEQALDEAENQYAKKINESNQINAVIITGIAGNDNENYTIKSKFLEKNKFKIVALNEKEMSSLLSPEIAKRLIETNKAELKDVPIDEKLFLTKAEKINQILHNGAINKNQRARVIGALLLSLVGETQPNVNESPSVLIQEINARANSVLQKEGKPEFYDYIKISLPSRPDNHIKFKTALVKTIQELNNLNIRSAMNSETDVLGKFYEVFLKYGNGAKEIGIVLTPRHITKFAVELFDISLNDIVFDPTCGTGGFLISAFDYIKKNANENQINQFKENNLFGIEQEPEVVALAVINMIFRGDGKNNVIEGNCFQKYLNLVRKNGNTAEYIQKDFKERISPISKVLMNPPFALKTSDEKEFKFVEQALEQMYEGGFLFSVLPTSVMVKQGQYLIWRKDSLLRNNTLLAVINFPDDLFYPIGVLTCGIIVKKGIPHPKKQKVLWIDIKNDGFLKSKGKRLPSERAENDLIKVQETIKKFIKDPKIDVKNVPEFQKTIEIDLDDKTLELIPEAYLNEKKPSKEEIDKNIGEILRNEISFIVKEEKEKDFKKEVLSDSLFKKPIHKKEKIEWVEVPINELFKEPIDTGEYHVSAELDVGDVPLVSCRTENHGFEGYFTISQEKVLKNAITIASDGTPLTSFYHFYPFVAKDNVIMGIPKTRYKFTTLLFITTQLNGLRWRFSYGRKCYLNKIHKIKIFLPFTNNKINEDYIEYLFKQSSSWQTLEKLFK